MDSYTLNKIAVEPFADTSVKTETHGTGEFKIVKIANTKTQLVKLKVVFSAKIALGTSVQFIPAGSFVWVRADQYSAPWGKEVFTLNENKFILLPSDRVEVFE